jgi:putative heme-binding domain-containing protein
MTRQTLNVLILCWLLGHWCSPAAAQRNLTNIPAPDPAAELAAMQVAEGFEVNLFAADPDFSKPIHMNWDSQGRLWIASSQNYPQLKPGASPTDQIVVLEDTDGDGVADKRTVFADNLMIPTGVLPGDGGVYVANSTELIHLMDTNGDGRADQRRTVLSGFGTEDTHHLLHTLRWRPDLRMAMNQSIYIHSHLETPFGVKHLDGGGIWHFNPRTFDLEVFSKGLVNPWGHAIDEFGQSLATDGAGGEGINYPFPGSVFLTSPGEPRWVSGLNPGSPKHCGLEFLSGPAIPAELQGVLVTNDFRGHRVCLFRLERQGSAYRSLQLPDLIRSEHIAFRPIDVKMGPDGALYIADWYNPIIQHGEVDFRDPRRDTEHGRIWRVTYKGLPTSDLPDYKRASEVELIGLLSHSGWWVRQFAREELALREPQRVEAAFEQSDLSAAPHLPLQPLWYQLATNSLDPAVLDSLRQHPDPRLRAAAMRVIGEQHTVLESSLAWLTSGVDDMDDQVVLESVCGLHRIGSLDAVRAILLASQRDNQDQSLRFAIWNGLRQLESTWLPAFESGDLTVEHPSALDALADAASTPAVARYLARQLAAQAQAAQGRSLQLIANRGDAESLAAAIRWLLTAQRPQDEKARLLEMVLATTAARKLAPADPDSWLPAALGAQPITDSQAAGWLTALARAAAQWGAKSSYPLLNQWLDEGLSSMQPSLLAATLSAIAELGADAGRERVMLIAADRELSVPLQLAAVGALSRFDSQAAAQQLVAVYAAPTEAAALPVAAAGEAVRALLSRQSGADALKLALAATQPEQWSPDLARELISAIRSSSQATEELVQAVVAASGLEHAGWRLTQELSNRLASQVFAQGDPVRGQEIYRREKLQCVQCHAIGKSGVEIGPNLVSLGGSSQLDYIIESLIDPAAKAKEGYQTISLLLDSGEVVNGLQKSRTNDILQLLLSDGTLRSVPIDSIDDMREGKSLMPAGLVDQLSEREIVDLVAFLSSLGRVPEFTVATRNIVRNWQLLEWSDAAHRRFNRTSFDTVARDDPDLTWRLLTTRVDGTAPLPAANAFRPHAGVPPKVFVKCSLRCVEAGAVKLQFNQPTNALSLWLNGNARPTPSAEQTIELGVGEHTLVIGIRLEETDGSILCEVVPVNAVVELP